MAQTFTHYQIKKTYKDDQVVMRQERYDTLALANEECALENEYVARNCIGRYKYTPVKVVTTYTDVENEAKEYPDDCYNEDGSLKDPGEGYEFVKANHPNLLGDEIWSYIQWKLLAEHQIKGYPIMERQQSRCRRKI